MDGSSRARTLNLVVQRIQFASGLFDEPGANCSLGFSTISLGVGLCRHRNITRRRGESTVNDGRRGCIRQGHDDGDCHRTEIGATFHVQINILGVGRQHLDVAGRRVDRYVVSDCRAGVDVCFGS